MTLDVSPPPVPELAVGQDAGSYDDADPQSDEYRRDELQELLHEGAWTDAFEQWAASTPVEESDWAIVRDLGLTERFDFFWDNNQTTR